MARHKFIALTSLVATFLALCVIALGAYTRLVDAGLGCPDWPGCYGQLTVPLTDKAREIAAVHYPATPLVAHKAWAEMVHRYVVGGLSLFILCIIAAIFSKKTVRTRGNIIFAVCLLLLLSYQIMLGQWTVTLKLLPLIVTQHLLGGFLILAILWLIYLYNRHQFKLQQRTDGRATDFRMKSAATGMSRLEQDSQSIAAARADSAALKKLFPFAVLAVIFLLLQITLGAWTSTHYASLSCPDFPFCINEKNITLQLKEAFVPAIQTGINYEGGVLPESVRQTIHMAHRFGALVLTLYLFIFSAFAMRKLKQSPELMQPLYLILGLLCVQLCIGISNVILRLPLISALSHTVTAALLLLAVITFTFKVRASS